MNKTPIENPRDTPSIEADPLCPHCDYNLRELRETRCPECGESFTWDAVEAYTHARRAYQFEFQARRRPVRSFLKTTVSLIWPARFWRDFPVDAGVQRFALFVQLGISLILAAAFYVLGLTLLVTVEFLVWRGRWYFSMREVDYLLRLVSGHAMPSVICTGFMFTSLLLMFRLYGESIDITRRFFRVMTYAALTLLLYAVTVTILSKLISIIEDYYFPLLQLIHPDHVSSIAAVLFFTLSLRHGLEHELRVRRPWRITLSALFLTAVAIHALILGSGLVLGTYEWGENPITTWFTYVMDPFWFMNLW